MPSAPASATNRRITTWCGPHLFATLLVASGALLSAEEPDMARRAGLPAITATWSGLPARMVCRRLTELAGRPVILDRRLDPETPITLDVRETPFTAVLERLAMSVGGSGAVLPESIRIVPGRSAASLVLADTERARAVAALPAPARRLAAGRAAWSWEEGARPRDLIAAVADGAGIDLAGLDAIPHDHLAATELPPLPLAERLDLVLGQFDRRIDWASGRTEAGTVHLRIVPLPAAAAGDVVVVQGGAARGGPASPPPPRAGRRPKPAGLPTWTLEVAAPLDELLTTVAARLDLDLALDREGLRKHGISAGEIVRLSVKDVDRDGLLDRIVEPVGLRWAIEGRTLRVGPPSE
jgi:hypothetical protein